MEFLINLFESVVIPSESICNAISIGVLSDVDDTIVVAVLLLLSFDFLIVVNLLYCLISENSFLAQHYILQKTYQISLWLFSFL